MKLALKLSFRVGQCCLSMLIMVSINICFLLEYFFEKTVRSSIPSLPQDGFGGEESRVKVLRVFLVYVYVMMAYRCCHPQLVASAAAEAPRRARRG